MINPNTLRLVVAGPVPSVRRFLKLAAAKNLSAIDEDGDRQGGEYWLERLPISWRAIARGIGAKSSALRGLITDPERAWVEMPWESETGMLRVAIRIIDQATVEARRVRTLLQLASLKHRRICFVFVSQDPDTLEASGTYVFRGKSDVHELSELETRRLGKVVFKKHKVRVESDDPDELFWASHYLDMEQVAACEKIWEQRVISTMRMLEKSER